MKRFAKNTPVVLQVTFSTDETLEDPTGNAATVTITNAAGTAVVTAQVATRVSTGLYQYTLAPQALTNVLTAVWTGTFSGVVRSYTTEVEIVGGFYFSLIEGRASDSSLADTTKYPTAALIDARQEVADAFERIVGACFVPRYRRVTLNGKGRSTLALPDVKIRNVRSVTKIANDGTQTAFTNGELAGVRVSDTGVIERSTGIFDLGTQNIIVEYECGYDEPPPEVRRAAFLYFRYRLNLNRSGINDRATSFTSAQDGGTYRLDTAGSESTGLPEVDAVLMRPEFQFNLGLA